MELKALQAYGEKNFESGSLLEEKIGDNIEDIVGSVVQPKSGQPSRFENTNAHSCSCHSTVQHNCNSYAKFEKDLNSDSERVQKVVGKVVQPKHNHSTRFENTNAHSCSCHNTVAHTCYCR